MLDEIGGTNSFHNWEKYLVSRPIYDGLKVIDLRRQLRNLNEEAAVLLEVFVGFFAQSLHHIRVAELLEVESGEQINKVGHLSGLVVKGLHRHRRLQVILLVRN